jgi:hypothetical protein
VFFVSIDPNFHRRRVAALKSERERGRRVSRAAAAAATCQPLYPQLCRLHPKAASLFTTLPATVLPPHTAHTPPSLVASPRLHFLGYVPISIASPPPPPRLQPSLTRAAAAAAAMSGLYSQGFSPARNLSPQIRSNPDVDRYSGAARVDFNSPVFISSDYQDCFFAPRLRPRPSLSFSCLVSSMIHDTATIAFTLDDDSSVCLRFLAASTWRSCSPNTRSWGRSCRCCPYATSC